MHYELLAEVPAFSRGIPRTIKYKCAIIAHHERKAGEMQIIAHHERKVGEMQLSLTMKEKSEKCKLSLTMKEEPEKCQFCPFYDKKMHNFHIDQSIKQSEFR